MDDKTQRMKRCSKCGDMAPSLEFYRALFEQSLHCEHSPSVATKALFQSLRHAEILDRPLGDAVQKMAGEYGYKL